MKTSSAKAKGRKGCSLIKKLLLAFAPHLLEDDILVTSSGVTGVDLVLSPKARESYDFCIEVKNVEKLNVREAYAQARSHQKKNEVPILFHTRNRDSMLVTLKAEDFLQLLKGPIKAGEDGESKSATVGQSDDGQLPGQGEEPRAGVFSLPD